MLLSAAKRYNASAMSDVVRQIKERLNIIDVVSPYVELHKAGKNFKGKSPFSAEKTPSFFVSPDRGVYYCFSTSQGGDIFNFIEAMEGVDFKGALKILAEKAGVELVPEDPKKRSERDRLYVIMEEATKFYVKALEKELAAEKYLKERGVSGETVTKWRIGFAPGPLRFGWRELKDFLNKAGYKNEELYKAGLIKDAGSGKEPFDVFRDRVMFPLFDASGKVVAFSGRILHPNDKAPKYVNSPETPLYKKSELLFGYDKAREGIRKLNFSLIVEGQFDVVMSHQAGYTNTVAVSGTALTLHHVQLLERLSDRVVLALDADRAGIAAMKKAAALMLRRGLDVKIAELPLGQDPADLILADKEKFKSAIGQAVHVIEFLLHILRREVDDDRSFKLRVRDEVLPFVLMLPSRIDQEHFVSIIAKAIKTTDDAIRFELERIREEEDREPTRANLVESRKNKVEDKIDVTQKAFVYLNAALDIIDAKLAQKIKSEMDKLETAKELPPPADSDLAGVIFSLEQQFAAMPPLAIADEVVNRLNQLKTGLLRRKIAECREELKQAEAEDESDKMMTVLQEIKKHENKLREPDYKPEEFLSDER